MALQPNSGTHNSSTEASLMDAATTILQVFNKHDVDEGGTLQYRELRNLLRQCGSKVTSSQCEDIIGDIDYDGDGEMNFSEFMAFLGRLYQLQFFGSDPGNFWKSKQKPSHLREPKPAPRASKEQECQVPATAVKPHKPQKPPKPQ
ncbi:calmodulin-like [Clavelina lepadiformis]|uniref:calmodulin-like n=1 Tax=Clavelina lepadiformis TaxID=159417 RepID=UPI004042CB75